MLDYDIKAYDWFNTEQTLTNIQPHIVNILQHGSQALTESLTHTGTSSENVETL